MDPDAPIPAPPPQDARPRRGRACLLACGLLLVVMVGGCCLSGALLQSALTDPDMAEARMQALIPSGVPAGYAGHLSIELEGLLAAALAPEQSVLGEEAFIILAVAAPPQRDSAVALAQLRQGAEQQFQLRVSERSETVVTVRGVEHPAQVVRGTTGAGTPVEIVSFVTARRGADDPLADALGDVVLFAGGPEASFDAQAWAEFLASIE